MSAVVTAAVQSGRSLLTVDSITAPPGTRPALSPNCFNSFLYLLRRFWNQIFTWHTQQHSMFYLLPLTAILSSLLIAYVYQSASSSSSSSSVYLETQKGALIRIQFSYLVRLELYELGLSLSRHFRNIENAWKKWKRIAEIWPFEFFQNVRSVVGRWSVIRWSSIFILLIHWCHMLQLATLGKQRASRRGVKAKIHYTSFLVASP